MAHDDRLEAHHPLRQLAWLAMANRAASDGDLASAQAHFQHAGLTEEQCSLLSLPPAIRKTNVDPGDYPISAAMMGFEGWVRLEYDISADGNTANVRPIVAYPAMIFVDAAKAIGTNLKYEWSYRPGGSGGLQCEFDDHQLQALIRSIARAGLGRHRLQQDRKPRQVRSPVSFPT